MGVNLRKGGRGGYFGEYFLNLLVLNQDLQDFQDYRGRLRFKRKGARRGLLYMLLFAGALRIGEKLGNESTVYNNLTIQTGDLIINPENPDSKSDCKYQSATLS